jgi:predicted Zn-dependent peptidase
MNMRDVISLTLALGMALASVTAPAETPPPGGEPRDFQLVEPEIIRLDNGLTATLVTFGDVPKTTVLISVRTGNLNEGGRTWLADLTGELLTQGTASATGSELAARAASMGGALSVATGLEQTTLSIDVLEDYAAEAIALLAEVLREPAFPESELARVRADLERSRSIAVTQPQQIATEAFRGLVYGDHPFGKILPSADELASYGIDDVREYYEGNFGALRTRVYVGGRFAREDVAGAIREAFGEWPAGPEVITDIPEPAEGPQFLLVDRPGAQQSTLRLGLPVADPQSPDWTRLGVMNTLLGGFFSSRIIANIREDKGYTYSPRSILETHYRDALWVQQADVTSEHTGDSLREIFAEIRRLQEEAPAEPEVERVRNYLAGTFVLGNASRLGILSQLAYVDFHGLNRSYLTEYVERVQGVSAEDIQAAAAEWLPISEMTLVVVGDAESVSPQLEAVEALKPLLEPGT